MTFLCSWIVSQFISFFLTTVKSNEWALHGIITSQSCFSPHCTQVLFLIGHSRFGPTWALQLNTLGTFQCLKTFLVLAWGWAGAHLWHVAAWVQLWSQAYLLCDLPLSPSLLFCLLFLLCFLMKVKIKNRRHSVGYVWPG